MLLLLQQDHMLAEWSPGRVLCQAELNGCQEEQHFRVFRVLLAGVKKGNPQTKRALTQCEFSSLF